MLIYSVFVSFPGPYELNSSALGNESFRERICALAMSDPEIPEARRLLIVDDCGCGVDCLCNAEERHQEAGRRSRKENHARAAAIYCWRKMGGFPLNEIAEYFDLNHYGSASGAVNRFVRLTEENPKFNRFV